MVNTIYLLSFVETPRKFIIAELSIRKLRSSSGIISTDEDPSLRIESSAIINLRGVSTKLSKYNVLILHIVWCCWEQQGWPCLNLHFDQHKFTIKSLIAET